MRWLTLEVCLIDGHYHGRSDEGRSAQWPPNPHRVFQALVAAGHLGWRRTEFGESKKAALRWLEQRPAPEIIAPLAHPASTVRLYVPNNDMDKVAQAWAKGFQPEKPPSALRTDKDLRPHILQDDAPMRFLWPIADEEWNDVTRQFVGLLCEEAHHLHTLGLGMDLVAGNGRVLVHPEKQALAGQAYVPDAGGSGWRVPVAGSLDELLERHQETLRARVRMVSGRSGQRWVAPPVPPRIFSEVAYVRRAKGRQRPVHAFSLVDADGAYRSFDPCNVMIVAAWLRHAAHERAKKLKLDPQFIERFVCGHTEEVHAKSERFSYLPLPTIPTKGRDGRIRRVLVAEPFGLGDGRALSVVRRLGNASLVDEHTGEVMAELRLIDSPLSDAIVGRYLRPMRRWASVTPVVLPGHDDRRSTKAHGLILKALAQAGYTTPIAEVHLQWEPVFPGAEMAIQYRVPAYLAALPRTHVIINFSEPVPGPVAIGAGRHVGLGVFANLDR